MAKLKNDPVLRVDFEDYLSGHSDFGFELSVLKMLRELDIECEHGGHYEDPVTGKSREFDIRAIKTIHKLRVRLAIECKNIRENFPILVSCVPRQGDEAYHQVALLSEEKERDYLSPGFQKSRASVVSIQGKYSMYCEGEPVGKSTVQVGRTQDGLITANDSELYEKWGQCLSSVNDLAQRMYWDGDEDDPEDSYQSTIIPIVVVPEGRLWTTMYNNDGVRMSAPAQHDRCSCFIGKRYDVGSGTVSPSFWISHMEIMTFNGLKSFVQEVLMSEQGMGKLFSKEGILDYLNKKYNR